MVRSDKPTSLYVCLVTLLNYSLRYINHFIYLSIYLSTGRKTVRVTCQSAITDTSLLAVTRDVVQRANIVRDLEFTLNSELSMQNHISKVTRTCFYHIRRLKQVRKLFGPDVVSLVFSRLDYCNAILAGLPRSTIAPLQRVQNAAARLVARLGPYDHVTATLNERHWLSIESE